MKPLAFVGKCIFVQVGNNYTCNVDYGGAQRRVPVRPAVHAGCRRDAKKFISEKVFPVSFLSDIQQNRYQLKKTPSDGPQEPQVQHNFLLPPAPGAEEVILIAHHNKTAGARCKCTGSQSWPRASIIMVFNDMAIGSIKPEQFNRIGLWLTVLRPTHPFVISRLRKMVQTRNLIKITSSHNDDLTDGPGTEHN